MILTRLVNSARSWRYVLWETYQRSFPPHHTRTPISWPLDPGELSHLAVRWPASYDCEEAEIWMANLRAGFRRYVRVDREPLAQSYRGDPRVVLLEFVWKGRPYPVAVDYSDYLDRLHEDCLKDVALYFKMQYLRGGYGSDKVVPGGYVNPSPDYYKYLGRLRALRDRPPVFDVYGRFGLTNGGQVRQRAVRLLTEQRAFRYEGATSTVRYSRSLIEAARAKVCIDLPGNGPFCFRLLDYLGIGSCVIGPAHPTALHVPLEDRKHIVYAKDDLSDLIDLCRYYVEHEAARAEIVRNSRDFFDRYLHRDQLAAYYLFTALERLR